MKKSSKYSLILSGIFVFFIGAFFLANLITPEKTFSEQENRYLQTLPSFSFNKLFSGAFTSDYEDYCSDQFIFRDQWISLKARLELLQGKSENNGVYLCENENLIIPVTEPNEDTLQNNIAAVNEFANKTNANVSIGIIPNKAGIYSDLLPNGVDNINQEQWINESIYPEISFTTLDLYSALNSRKSEEIFYRTDHHWTTLGAYYAYLLMQEGLPNSPSAQISPEVVSSDFYGTTYSSSGFSWISPDYIEKYIDADPIITKYEVSSSSEAKLYNPDKLEAKDQYSYFMGGNTPLAVIQTGNSGPKLLLIRDSYSDALVPFLLSHYSEIHMIDLRYYKQSVTEYINQNNIDQAIILYCIDNFLSENLSLLSQ